MATEITDNFGREPSPHIPDAIRMVLKFSDYNIEIPTKNGSKLHTRFDNAHFLGEGVTSKVLLVDSSPEQPNVEIDQNKLIAKIITNEEYISSGDLAQEIAIHQQVNHPNIATLVDHSQAEPQKTKNEKYYYPCLIKEYLPTSLEEHIQKGDLNEAEILRIFQALCDAIQHVYDKTGEVVIDIEPAQIRFTENGICKLNDLGYTANNEVGSVHNYSEHYTDPDVAETKRAEPKHVVYNLSLLLWQCYTGKNFVNKEGPTNNDNKIPAAVFNLIETGIKRNKNVEVNSSADFYKQLLAAYHHTLEQS